MRLPPASGKALRTLTVFGRQLFSHQVVNDLKHFVSPARRLTVDPVFAVDDHSGHAGDAIAAALGSGLHDSTAHRKRLKNLLEGVRLYSSMTLEQPGHKVFVP